MNYIYRGDRQTAPELRGMLCWAVRRADGKCIRGGSKMLVEDANGRRFVVIGSQLRKVAQP